MPIWDHLTLWRAKVQAQNNNKATGFLLEADQCFKVYHLGSHKDNLYLSHLATSILSFPEQKLCNWSSGYFTTALGSWLDSLIFVLREFLTLSMQGSCSLSVEGNNRSVTEWCEKWSWDFLVRGSTIPGHALQREHCLWDQDLSLRSIFTSFEQDT